MSEVVVLGIGQLGHVFAGGFLRCGHTVVPVNRGDHPGVVADRHPHPELVLVAVAEADFDAALASIPLVWRGRVALLQNELLPADWERHGFADPTVISVWFEKKPGRDPKPLIASPVAGPGAALMIDALAAMNLPAREVASGDALLFELVVKNVYILTTNLAGLRTGGTVGELWDKHQAFARAVAADVIALQEALTGRRFDHESLIAGMLEAFAGDPEHQCMGRSAPARLQRALAHADRHGLQLPTLRSLAA
ncbi:MAG: hypothetical protein LDL19_05955 [Thiobacillus sp.]|nr:hypothetical protein [Thiobacillus sp.]